jgi:hypothetical protein
MNNQHNTEKSTAMKASTASTLGVPRIGGVAEPGGSFHCPAASVTSLVQRKKYKFVGKPGICPLDPKLPFAVTLLTTSNFNIAINNMVESITRAINNDWVWLSAAFPTRNDFPAGECTNKIGKLIYKHGVHSKL